MQAGRLIDQQNSDSKTGETVQLIKKVAKDHHVSTNQIYSSSTTLADGMTLQIGKNTILLVSMVINLVIH